MNYWRPPVIHVRKLRIGMIGIGVGGAEILPAMESMDQIDLVAGADIVPATLARFAGRYPETFPPELLVGARVLELLSQRHPLVLPDPELEGTA